jgi:hypothetical protein
MTLRASTTNTTFDPNPLLRHAATKALGTDLRFLSTAWPIWVAVGFLLVMVWAKRAQDRRYRRSPGRTR